MESQQHARYVHHTSTAVMNTYRRRIYSGSCFQAVSSRQLGPCFLAFGEAVHHDRSEGREGCFPQLLGSQKRKVGGQDPGRPSRAPSALTPSCQASPTENAPLLAVFPHSGLWAHFRPKLCHCVSKGRNQHIRHSQQKPEAQTEARKGPLTLQFYQCLSAVGQTTLQADPYSTDKEQADRCC